MFFCVTKVKLRKFTEVAGIRKKNNNPSALDNQTVNMSVYFFLVSFYMSIYTW